MSVTVTITISEQDGQLHISGHVPDEAQNTVAGILAMQLLDVADVMLTNALGTPTYRSTEAPQ